MLSVVGGFGTESKCFQKYFSKLIRAYVLQNTVFLIININLLKPSGNFTYDQV
jgi:hypothetical protein